jgi:uncharacterized protein (DUF779 family)
MGHMIALYEQVLIDYIYDNRTYSKWDFTKIIILTIKGHEYHFSANSGREIKIIRPAEIQYMT